MSKSWIDKLSITEAVAYRDVLERYMTGINCMGALMPGKTNELEQTEIKYNKVLNRIRQLIEEL